MDDHCMPARADSDLLLRIVHRHGLNQSGLARLCGLSEGYLSRVLSGQYPAPASLLTAAYRATRDEELRRYLLGVDEPHAFTETPVADRAGGGGRAARPEGTRPAPAADDRSLAAHLADASMTFGRFEALAQFAIANGHAPDDAGHLRTAHADLVRVTASLRDRLCARAARQAASAQAGATP